jgi:hypothetical protein
MTRPDLYDLVFGDRRSYNIQDLCERRISDGPQVRSYGNAYKSLS